MSLTLLFALQLVILLALALLLFRRPAPQDARLQQLPDTLAHHHTRHDTRLESLGTGLETLRTAHDGSARHLREELIATIDKLSQTLHTHLDHSRKDHEALRATLAADLAAVNQRLATFIHEANRHQLDAREALHTRLTGLAETNAAHQEKLRAEVSGSLAKLNADNEAKLEQMRQTVDEKLTSTLHQRLDASFGLVSDQLTKVHLGLGEMSKLSGEVGDLSRIFTNVKSRGGFAEVQLGMLLEQMLAPSQFVRNARVKPNTQEVVEFAVRFPGHGGGQTLLPIDAKFPREDWERLEAAYTANSPDLLAEAGKRFEAAIRTEGKRICGKYINPPTTTPHAIMFLPTEGLYAEVMRRDALQAEIQSQCQVTIAGPSTLSAILTSFQMGFHMLALQEKGDEVWRVLESTKTEFKKFGLLLDKVEKQVGTVQTTLREIGGKTTTINRTLREVSDPATAKADLLEFDSFPGIAPLLAASADDA